MGQSPPSHTYNLKKEGLPFFQGSKEFGWRKPIKEKWCSNPKRIAEQGDVLISVRAPVGDMNIAVEKCCIGRGLASIRGGVNVSTSILFYMIKNNIEIIKNISSAGSVFDSLNKKTLSEIKVALPPKELRNKYYIFFEELFNKINRLDDENVLLQQIRDTLLPKLMNGELTINNVEL